MIALFWRPFLFTEMRNRYGQNLAPGTFYLRPLRKGIRRRRLSRERRPAILSKGFLLLICPALSRMSEADYEQLHYCFELAVASGMLRLSGKSLWFLLPEMDAYRLPNLQNFEFRNDCSILSSGWLCISFLSLNEVHFGSECKFLVRLLKNGLWAKLHAHLIVSANC